MLEKERKDFFYFIFLCPKKRNIKRGCWIRLYTAKCRWAQLCTTLNPFVFFSIIYGIFGCELKYQLDFWLRLDLSVSMSLNLPKSIRSQHNLEIPTGIRDINFLNIISYFCPGAYARDSYDFLRNFQKLRAKNTIKLRNSP